MLRRRPISAVLVWLCTACVAAPQATRDARLEQIDAYIRQAMSDWKVPGAAVAIVKDDAVVFAKGYGVRELGDHGAVDGDTIFPIASNSKAFTAAALAMLVDEGKINWDDPVAKYLPSFQLHDPYVTREMTVRDLLCHRSGLRTFSGDLLWYETHYSREEVLRRARYLRPTASFRSQYGYQNLMFLAAGEIVAAVSGKSWDEFVRERIFQPLGMRRATTTVRGLERMDNVARPHNQSTGKLRVLPFGNVDGAGGAAAINSSVRDLAQWVRLQLGRGQFEGRRIFSPKASREMWSPHMIIRLREEDEEIIPSRHFSLYGLGWGLSDYRGMKLVTHGGALDGFFSATALVPEANLGVVVLTNSETPLPSAVWRKVVDAFLGAPERDWNADLLRLNEKDRQQEAAEEQKRTAERVQGTRPSLPLNRYAGSYRSELYGDVVVAAEGGKLVMRFVPAPRLIADLEHWHYDTFLIRWRESVPYNFTRQGFVSFQLKARGQPENLLIDQPNRDWHFDELELKRVQAP